MRDAGFSEAAVAKARAEALREIRTGPFVVHPDNANAVRLFQAMATQWNMTAISSLAASALLHTGLRYEVLPVIRAELEIDRHPGDFERLQVMEGEAIAALARSR